MVDIQAWITAIGMIAQLGVSLKKLIALIRETLTPDQADLVLAGVKQGWAITKAENDARIAELEALIASE